MNRIFLTACCLALALASLVLAQAPSGATLQMAAGSRPLQIVQQGGQTYVSAIDVVTALEGTITPDSTGFKVTINKAVAAFGTDSRFGVVRDELVEMPATPIVVEGKPYVPWQFFRALLPKIAELDASWDSVTRTLALRPAHQATIAAQVSLANVQGISKIVITLTGAVEYAIVREETAYIVRFKTPLQGPFAEKTYDDPHVAGVAFQGNDLRILLTGPDVIGDAYQLEEPFRIILDLRKGAGQAPGALPQITPQKVVDPPGIRTIVIDPGHGGKEVGAIGPNGLMEKDATLALCRKLSAALSSKLGARVILTREDDSVVALDQRTTIANQYRADLFLSVHMNAAVVKGAHGSETYFLSLEASDELARKAAEVENAASSGGKPDAASDLRLILWDLAQQEYLQESSRFASVIQEEMNAITGVTNRGVKQAPFKVLVGATMPAALVEVAFITNPEEEAKLQSEEFLSRVADALTAAVQRYKTDYELRAGIARPAIPTLKTGPATAADRSAVSPKRTKGE